MRIDEHFAKLSRNAPDEDLGDPWKRAVELGEKWVAEEGNDENWKVKKACCVGLGHRAQT